MKTRRCEILASPIKVGNIMLKNKLMTTSMSPVRGYIEDEAPTIQMLNYLEERAAGGLGLMCQTVLPFTRKDRPEGLPPVHPLPAAYDEDSLPGLTAMAEVVRRHDCALVGQPWFVHDWKPDDEHVEGPWAPTNVNVNVGRTKWNVMERRHMDMFIGQMVNCALLLQKAGWDGVEIMAGVGGILNRFMSPATNNRTDEYGGCLKNRMRFPVEVIKAVREAVGPDFLITCRWSPVEYVTGVKPGNTINDALLIVPYLEEAGIDLHNLAVGWHETSIPLTTKDVPDGSWAWISEKIKTVATKPVAMGYRNTDPLIMEKNLREGKMDMVAGLRYDIADPNFPKKVMEDRLEDINRCIGCCRCLDDVVSSGKPLNYCSVNPHLGKELRKPMYIRTKSPKKVLVAGSGPGGLAAALTASIRGHDVTIFERGYRIGGCLTMSSIFSPSYEYLLKYYKRQLQKHPKIKVKLHTEVTPELVAEFKPDAVVLAIGGEPVNINVPGAEGGNVVTSHDFLEMLNGRAPQKPGLVNKVLWNAGSEFLKYIYWPGLGRTVTGISPWPMGHKIAVIGGGLPGVELSHLLMHKNRKLDIIEERKKIGFDVGGSYRFHYTSAFKKAPNVEMDPLTTVEEINSKGVKMKNASGREKFYRANTVTVTKGFKPNMALAAAIRKQFPDLELYVVGDCINPARMADATKAGYIAGCEL